MASNAVVPSRYVEGKAVFAMPFVVADFILFVETYRAVHTCSGAFAVGSGF